jgi:N6-adenosine-specific RNA methylase IME4
MTQVASTSLVNYDAARSALQKAHRVDEVKSIRDKAEAIRVYARQANDTEMQNWAVEIKLRAERRAGELIKQQQDIGALASKEKGRPRKCREVTTLKSVGISRDQSAKWQKLAAVPEPKFEQIVAEAKEKTGELTSAAVLREVVQAPARAAKQAVAERIKHEPAPPPTGPFRVIAIDPPWQYESRANDPTHRAANPYPDMTLDAIKALPVADLAHADCILWLWTTNAFIGEALECLAAWGFEKKSIVTWVKDRMGLGDWLRGRTEHCLMAARGKPIREPLTNQTTVITGPLREHSRKPDSFYSLVESLCPGNKAEMFACEAREGWTAINAPELGKFAKAAATN